MSALAYARSRMRRMHVRACDRACVRAWRARACDSVGGCARTRTRTRVIERTRAQSGAHAKVFARMRGRAPAHGPMQVHGCATQRGRLRMSVCVCVRPSLAPQLHRFLLPHSRPLHSPLLLAGKEIRYNTWHAHLCNARALLAGGWHERAARGYRAAVLTGVVVTCARRFFTSAIMSSSGISLPASIYSAACAVQAAAAGRGGAFRGSAAK